MEASKLAVVPMALPFAKDVSVLLAEAFHTKFKLILHSSQLAKGFEMLLTHSSENRAGIRVAAIHDGAVVGTLALQWSRASSEIEADWPSLSDIATLCKGLGVWTTMGLLVGITLLSHTSIRGECYITDIAVDSRFRGKGIGNKLMTWAKQYAASQPDFNRLSLHVSVGNDGARYLYERLQFSAHSVQPGRGNLLGRRNNWIYMTTNVASEPFAHKVNL